MQPLDASATTIKNASRSRAKPLQQRSPAGIQLTLEVERPAFSLPLLALRGRAYQKARASSLVAPRKSVIYAKVIASTYVFPVPFALTCRSENRQVSFHLLSPQQANEVLRHDLPTFRLTGHDISAGPFFLSMRFPRLGHQPRQLPYSSSSTAFQPQHDA